MSEEYRVNLEVYNGPLDLLLYLIRREEVDIHDIPIARITEQYMKYVEMLRKLDPNLAGEFLVLAAALMEIKTRMLLPAPELDDAEAEDYAIDPRADLVRQLLQYKAFKDAADELSERADAQALKFARRPAEIDLDDDVEHDLENVQIWDLFDAFRKVMDAIGQRSQVHEVIYDDTPIDLHAADILDRLHREGAMTFDQIFEGRDHRSEIVGLFLAMLELLKQQKIWARQDENFADIRIEINPDPPSEEELEAAEEAARAEFTHGGEPQYEGPVEAGRDAIVVTESDFISDEGDEELPDVEAAPDPAVARGDDHEPVTGERQREA